MNNVKSRGTWGKRKERSNNELNAILGDFFKRIVLPDHFKLLKWDTCVSAGEVISVGKLYLDTRTSGIDIVHYRICFLTYSENGAVCEKRLLDFNKAAYKCVVNNKSPEFISDFISKIEYDKGNGDKDHRD